MRSDMLAEARRQLQDYRELQRLGLICRSGEFYPAVHYPPITRYPRATPEELLAGYTPPADGLFSIYVHVPFCAAPCSFCHYPVKFGSRPAEIDRYLDTLEREMDLWRARMGLARIPARSVLLGGGTPSHLSPRQLRRFLEGFWARVDPREAQVSIDVHPDTVLGPEGAERRRLMRDLGVHRITLGLQSLDDATLKRMNRSHGAAAAIRSVEVCLEGGFDLDIEFIFGYPGDTLESWAAGISRAVELGVPEIQLYRLKVIPYGDRVAPLSRGRGGHLDGRPSLDDTILMKALAHQILGEHGYRENLSRVFTRRREDYSRYAADQCCGLLDQVGFGQTAFSSYRDRFTLNTDSFEGYYRAVEEGRLPIDRGLVRSLEEQARWSLMLPLKHRSLPRALFRDRTGLEVDQVFPRRLALLREHGLLEDDGHTLRLTRRGRFVSEEIAHLFFHPSHLPHPRGEYEEGPLSPYAEESAWSPP